ncbi:MAG: type III secretion system cytoplasmic ring protein SctQ [Alphaproteobacteria bacterium]|nr:type III secretion system cytoplasmic ring protein SctQ [Alphaproteobacteria bacterium]
MLNWFKVHARDGKLMTSSLATKRPLLPRIAPAQIEGINRFYCRRQPVHFRLANRLATLEALWPRHGDGVMPGYRLSLTVDGVAGTITVVEPLIETIVREVDPTLSLSSLVPEIAGLLVEAALACEIDALEQLTGCRLSITSVRLDLRAFAGPDPSALSCMISVDGVGRSRADLRFSLEAATRLTQLLDASNGRVDAGDEMVAPLCARVAVATVSVEELINLSPGDVVLVDGHCWPPTMAIAVIGEFMVACMERTDAGATIAMSPVCGRGSPWEWSMDDVADQSRKEVNNGGPDDMPVKLVFEIGRVELTVREIRKLGVGTIVPLLRPVEDSLDVVANGRRIGRGSLVQIGESLGVRLTRLFDTD